MQSKADRRCALAPNIMCSLSTKSASLRDSSYVNTSIIEVQLLRCQNVNFNQLLEFEDILKKKLQKQENSQLL